MRFLSVSEGKWVVWALWVLRAALGGFFFWSGLVKLQDLSAFTQAVANYEIVSRPYDAVVAYFVPWLEVIVALSLITGVMARGGLVILMGMLLGFSAAIGWVWHQGLDIDCGCYGSSGDGEGGTSYFWHLAANAGLFLLTTRLLVVSVLLEKRKSALN